MSSEFHVVIECFGLPAEAGARAARDIADEFKNRPWHQNVECTWDGAVMRLEADNDYDENGLALQDELSDLTSACVEDPGEES